MAKPRSSSSRAKRRRAQDSPARGAGPRTGPGDRPQPTRRGSAPPIDPLAAAVVALALVLRLWGVGDHLPDPKLGINVLDDTAVEETDRTTSGRAWTMWGGGTKPLDLNPHTGGWPALSFYAALGLQYGYRLVYFAGNPGSDAAAYADHIQKGSDRMFLFARTASVIVGVASVLLTYMVGYLLWGRAAGLIASLFLAANPLHILTSQHIADPNLLALFFVLLATLPLIRIARGEAGLRDSILAGAMIGLASACKYAPLVLVIPLAVAHLGPGEGRRRRLSSELGGLLRNRALYLALAAVAAALFLGSPYTFLDWKTTVKDLAIQRRALFSDWVGQTTFPISLPSYLVTSLPHAMGWPAYLLSLFGLGLLWRRGRAGQAAVLIPVVMVLANGALRTAQERYVLLALPILFVGTGAALDWGLERWKERVAARATGAGESATPGAGESPAPPRRAPAATGIAAAAGIAALCIIWPLPEFLAVRRALALPDTRHLARKWINANIDPQRPMAVELYGPVFQPGERALVIWPFFATQVPMVRPAYLAPMLDGLEYYVLSGEISRRFDADSLNYPVESAYYRWIRAHAPVVWRSDPESTSGPRIEVRRIPPGVSTEAERDSVFALALPTPTGVNRLALWAFDYSQVFARIEQFDRSREWALRGIRIGAGSMNAKLCGALAYAQLKRGEFEQAERVAGEGVSRFPREAMLHLYHGMALHELARLEEAEAEFRSAYELSRDARVLQSLGTTLTELERFEDALNVFALIPPDHAERGTARRNMAVILLNHLGRSEEGLEALMEAARLERNPGQARLLQEEVDRLRAAKAPKR